MLKDIVIVSVIVTVSPTVVLSADRSLPTDSAVETRGYNQDGTLVCIFRRTVMVPKQSYLDARDFEQIHEISEIPSSLR